MDQKQEKPRTDRDVVTYQKFGGLRNDVSTERFEQGDLATGLNIDIDKSGRIARRQGFTKRVTADVHSLWAKDDLALCVNSSTLARVEANLTLTPLTNLLSPARMSYAETGGRTYFSNGTDTGILDGAVRSWGLPVPALPTAAIDAAAAIPAGRYQYVVTYVRDDGQESGAGLAGAIDVPAGGMSITFGVPRSNVSGVIEKNLYLTQPNGEVLYLAMSLPDALVSYTIDPADLAVMVEPLQTQFMQAAPAGQLVAYYKGRMFVAAGDTLYPSEPVAYELFDLRNFITLDGTITMLAALEDREGTLTGFFIGTDKSCGILTGNGPEDFKYVPKVDYGAILGAVVRVEGSLYSDGSMGARLLPVFLTTQGLCIGMPNMDIDNLSRTTFQFDASGSGAAIFFPGENRLVANSSVSPCIAMQTENQTFTQYTNYQFNSFAEFGGKYYGATAQGIFELVGSDDAGTPIAARACFGITDFSTAFVKAVDRVYMGFRSTQDMNVIVHVDEEQTFTYVAAATPELETSRVRVGKGLCGRYWQFEVQNTNGGDFTLDMLDVKTVRYQRRVNGRA